jgi:alpha-galactosidase
MLEIVKPSELDLARDWCRAAFVLPADSDPTHLPITFTYDTEHSIALLPNWRATQAASSEGDGYSLDVITFADPQGVLELRCEVKSYHAYPAVEWVAYLKNIGTVDSGILADILPLDVLFPLDPAAPCQVHHARGALTQQDDFEPLATPLTFRQGGSRLELAARTGKSSTLHLPFFNLQLGSGGVIGAIGWSGGWAATFQRTREGVHVRAGMERTHLRLLPGEEIRTPRILLLFWQGGDAADDGAAERVRSHNIWRRLLLEQYTPRVHGEVLQPPFCDGGWGAQSEDSHLAKIRWLAENRIPRECYWIDAGWYGERPVAEAADGLTSNWMREVGSWFPNAGAYPHGLAPISAAARAAGMGLLLWVEPERAFEGTQMAREHPEWLLGPVPSGNTNGMNYMVNLGNPAARQHVTELISSLITASLVTCYRQDFNDLRVPELFAMTDAPDRVGFTEIQHITGLYCFWDALLARHPDLVIDNCAGGGQRIDLETIARSVSLWRSDLQCWPFDPIAMQTQTQGLAPWVPLTAAVCDKPTAYAMRSALGPGSVTHWSTQALDGRADLPAATICSLMDEAKELRKYFYGDFYPLLSFSLAADAWAAWQYDRPDLQEGMVVAFRRQAAPFSLWEARLQGMEPVANYEVCAWESGLTWRSSGREMMANGFEVSIEAKPGSALFTYRRIT